MAVEPSVLTHEVVLVGGRSAQEANDSCRGGVAPGRLPRLSRVGQGWLPAGNVRLLLLEGRRHRRGTSPDIDDDRVHVGPPKSTDSVR